MAKKKYIFRGNISAATRKPKTFANCSNPVSPILILKGSVYSRNILRFIPAEDIDQIKLAGLNTLGVAPDGCNGLRSVYFVDAPDLGAFLLKMIQRTSECATKNAPDATNFLGYSISLKYYRNAS